MTATDRRPPYRFAHRIRVGFDETDAQGVVYYGRYMPYFDRARVEYLRGLGIRGHLAGEPEFAMRAQQVEYHAPARFDDELEVFVRAQRLGTTSITWAFDAYHVESGEHLASATQVAVAIAPGERRAVAIPDAVRTAIAGFEQEAGA